VTPRRITFTHEGGGAVVVGDSLVTSRSAWLVLASHLLRVDVAGAHWRVDVIRFDADDEARPRGGREIGMRWHSRRPRR
jgi:hypothetical protein